MTNTPEPERWARIAEIFAGALERSPSTRAAYLDAACARDAQLRSEVESLLASHDHGTAIPRLDEPSTTTPPDWRIGPYQLIEPIGSGGMGTVFLAERAGPDYTQRVALKLIRAGRTDPLLSERLRSERRILARLEHPHIARLIDGGITPDGQPFFAMEYVAGTSLTAYCDTHRLTVRERLRLFLRICEAVQHAHTQLVVHRDLKPSNILVSEDGHPKLLDFGIAKLVDPADDDVATRSGAWATPAYASPEQVRGDPVGTATDVYALGVLLYELLAGSRPYSVEDMAPAEAQRIICEDVPPRPSERVDDAAAHARSLSPERLRRDIEGDLDTIVLKTLAKEPARRYTSAAELANDLRRYLDGRPVRARPDSFAYRTTRFLQRHRAAVSAAMLVVLALAVGTALALTQARRATVERDRARGEAEKAQLVAGLMADLFRLSDPNQALGDTITARQLLDEGAARIERELVQQPDVQASLMVELARVYANLGLLVRADSLARRALSVRSTLYGAESVQVSESLGLLGTILAARGQRLESIDALQRALAIRDARSSAPDSLSSGLRTELAWQMRAAGQYDEARGQFERALSDLRALFGDGGLQTAPALLGVATTLHDNGQLDEAESLFRIALARVDTAPGRPHPLAASALFNIGMLRRLREQSADAEPLLRSAHAMRRALYDDNHPDVLDAAKEWGRALLDLARLIEAEDVLSSGLARAIQSLGPTHSTTTGLRNALASVNLASGQYAEAAARLDSVVAIERVSRGEHPQLVFALLRSGEARFLSGELSAAEMRFREALDMIARVSDDESVYRILAYQGLGNSARESQRHAEAADYYQRAEALAVRLLRRDHRYVRRLTRDHAILLLHEGKAARAVVLLDSTAAAERRVLTLPHPEHGRTLLLLGEALLAAGEANRGRANIREAIIQLAGLPQEHEYLRAAQRLAER